jgi:hypothetical protein
LATEDRRGNRASDSTETSRRQQQVWAKVRQTQTKLSDNIGASVQASQSASSLQLALENEKLLDSQRGYIKALEAAAEVGDDIVGYVFAVNGKLNSADIYPSNGLFRKMWSKLLTASAIEAISHKDEPRTEAPGIVTVAAFLADAESGKTSERPLNDGVRLETREGDKAYFFETAKQAGTPNAPALAWVHRNYLAK